MGIKQWYLSVYPEYATGKCIGDYCTFDGLLDCLDANGDVYAYLRVEDSLLRERCFEMLSIIMEIPYKDIYEKWLFGCEVRGY